MMNDTMQPPPPSQNPQPMMGNSMVPVDRPSITLEDDGFSSQSIFIKDSKPCSGIRATVGVHYFPAQKEYFQIKNIAKTGKAKDVLEVTGQEDNGDGTFTIQFNIKEGCKPSIFAYVVTYKDKFYDLQSEESKPFKVITNQNQMQDAEKEVAEYQFFRDNETVPREFFYTEFQSILLQKTQGYEALHVTASEDSQGLEASHRKATRHEQDGIIRHFFGDADPIRKSDEFNGFWEWFRQTYNTLRNPPFNELYVRGLIFVHVGDDALEQIMSQRGPGAFVLVCGLKKPGTVGIIVKGKDGVVRRRPLVTRTMDASGVASNLKKYEELVEILMLQGEKMVSKDKNEVLDQFPPHEQPREDGDFMDSPLYI